MPVYRIPDEPIYFPFPTQAEPNGLLAVGGDLRVERLLLAYTHGIFPWYNEGDPVMWWCPHTRFIIYPDQIHISHSMRKFMRKHDIALQINRDFSDTMHRCRTKREFREGTWITDDMERAYANLHAYGFATSVEAYVDGQLAGGLYGVNIGKCFFGESMFSDLENGSKLALILFSEHLAKIGYLMIDCQFHTDHLESMGGVSVPWDTFTTLLNEGCNAFMIAFQEARRRQANVDPPHPV